MPDDPIVAFARDFSGNDRAVVDRVRGLVAEPPADTPAIGFHGMGSAPARVRAFLASVVVLEGAGLIHAVEDKYVYEALWRWVETGAVNPARLPPTASAVFGPLLGPWDIEALDTPAYRERLWNDYGQATRELEDHIAANGRVLLSIDATQGDTQFFALVEPGIAERWRDKALCARDGYRSGVRAPMWDRFWDHLSYAGAEILVAHDREGYPPGTRIRSDAIPFAG